MSAALAIQIGSYLLWFPLKVLAIQAILNAGIRRYALVFTYMVVTLLLALIQVPVSLAYHGRDPSQEQWYQVLHSASQIITYGLILAMVLSFIYRASERVGPRRLLLSVLITGGIAVMAISWWARSDPSLLLGTRVTRWTRDMSVCAAILDLTLWGLLLSSRQPGARVLLLLTGGMGIMFSGEAIGGAVKDLAIRWQSESVFLVGHSIIVLADALFLYVWWQTFRKEAAARRALRASNHH